MDPEEIIINQALEEQGDMTAVEQFAFKKDFCQLPKEASNYKQLIPKTTPGPGQQYAFEVNLDQCSGCKACVTACHNENGLDEDETWRSVGLIHGTTPQGPAIQHVTSACHHCLEPACMHGCPVKAYEKDPVTGVVKHLDDQCIGCQYCILKCAYDVPKYSKKRGIVHKCDMCISRLNVGEAPACVRACPNEAIAITLVDTSSVRQNPSEFVNVPQAPDSSYTLPTTRYVTTKKFTADMTSSNEAVFEPEHSHLPLVVMLTLTQLSVGAFVMQWIMGHFIGGDLRTMLMPVQAWSALGIGILALGASIAHLGRPQYAFRAILGLKTSWLSREILAFGLFAKLAFVYAVVTQFFSKFHLLIEILAASVCVTGLLAVFSSVMVYRDTRRYLWDSSLTTFKFFMTSAILGTATMIAVSLSACANNAASFGQVIKMAGIPLAITMVILSLVKMVVEASLFAHLRKPELSSLKKSAILMTEHLKVWTMQRFFYGMIGGVLMPVSLLAFGSYLTIDSLLVLAWGMVIISVAAEMMERYLFFRAVVPLKMPH